MEVRHWMTQPVHSVKPLDSIPHAREVMERHRINQLPVLVDGRLEGIVTDRDLRDAFPSVFDSPSMRRERPKPSATDPQRVTVEMVMTPGALTVGAGDSIADAARLMRKQRIGALPVVEGERVIGILTRSDILDAFVDLAAIEESRETGAWAEEPVAAAPKARGRAPASKPPRRRPS
jgi:acetoin utilization protein AcuB